MMVCMRSGSGPWNHVGEVPGNILGLRIKHLRSPVKQGSLTRLLKANQWVLIADVQSTTVTNKTYWEGVCANRGDMAFNDTMKIVMGEVTDYFRPTEDMTLCEFLTSFSTEKSFRWAASEAGAATY